MPPDTEQMPTYINARNNAERMLQDGSQMRERTIDRIFASTHLAIIKELERDEEQRYTGRDLRVADPHLFAQKRPVQKFHRV